jgi:hypothetical protein
MQPGWLLHVYRSICSQWCVPDRNVLFGRSIVGHVHSVRPWQVLCLVRPRICVRCMPSWLIFFWWCCFFYLHRVCRWNAAKYYWAVFMCAMLPWHVLCNIGPQRPNWSLQSRIILVGWCFCYWLPQLHHWHLSTSHRAGVVLALQSRHVLRNDRAHRRNWKVCGWFVLRRICLIFFLHSLRFRVFPEPNRSRRMLAL